jgi:glycogen operon protein
MFNAGAEAVDFRLPPVIPGARWHLAVDTSREAPQDLFAAGEEPLWEDSQTYHLSPRSSAILLARGTNYQRRQTALKEAK